jgi:aminoglycoside phosphotransferase (APT) family kinase protein
MPFQSGTRLGSYEISNSLGAGGMGEVYRARDTRLNREVAIKVLPDLFASDVERLSRFEREAQVLASLNHPHIAQVYGVIDAPAALVMELVQGEDLSQRVSRGAIPIREALEIARQIADALAAAHEKGIVHRDLKPANIKLRDDGTVKVLGLRPGESGRAVVRQRTALQSRAFPDDHQPGPRPPRLRGGRHAGRCDSRHRRLHGARAGEGKGGGSWG